MGLPNLRDESWAWKLGRREDEDDSDELDDDEDSTSTSTTARPTPTPPGPPGAPPPPPPPPPAKSKITSSTVISTTSFLTTSTKISTTTSAVSTITSTSISVISSSSFSTVSTNPTPTTVLTTLISMLAGFSAISQTSTQGQRGLASAAPAIPVASSASLNTTLPAPSSAAQGINTKGSYGTGFYIGIGVAIGGTLAIVAAFVYILYRRKYFLSKPDSDPTSQNGSTQTHYHSHVHTNSTSSVPRSLWSTDSATSHTQTAPVPGGFVPPLTMIRNDFTGTSQEYTPGPTIPDRSTKPNFNVDAQSLETGCVHEKGSYHPDGLGRNPVTPAPTVQEREIAVVPQFPEKENNYTPSTVSTSILRIPASKNAKSEPRVDSGINTAVTTKMRATSAPIGVDALKLAREKELEMEVERTKMGKDWEKARRQGTGVPGSVTDEYRGDDMRTIGTSVASEDSLPRWRAPMSWVKDQTARLKGRERLGG